MDSVAEVVKYLLVGADVVMTNSSLLRNCVGYTKILGSKSDKFIGIYLV